MVRYLLPWASSILDFVVFLLSNLSKNKLILCQWLPQCGACGLLFIGHRSRFERVKKRVVGYTWSMKCSLKTNLWSPTSPRPNSVRAIQRFPMEMEIARPMYPSPPQPTHVSPTPVQPHPGARIYRYAITKGASRFGPTIVCRKSDPPVTKKKWFCLPPTCCSVSRMPYGYFDRLRIDPVGKDAVLDGIDSSLSDLEWCQTMTAKKKDSRTYLLRRLILSS